MSSASGNLSTAIPLGNQAFLQSLFGDQWERAHVCAVAGDPESPHASWGGGPARSWLRHLEAACRGTNNYFCVSTFTGDRRIEEEFVALWVLGIDDVGPKIDAQKVLDLLGEPTFRVQTSQGNEQWGYRLAVPITHAGQAKALQHAVRVALTGPEGRDPGQEHVTRYMRLPVGVNLKGKSIAIAVGDEAFKGFKVGQTSWSGRVIDQRELAALLARLAVPGTEDPVWSRDNGQKLHRLAANSPGNIEGDLLLKAMRKLDLVLSQARDSGMGTGFDVTCPWVDEHTDRGDTGTFFAPGRGFRCHHGHCDGKGLPDLPERLNELLIEESGGLDCLAGLDFDEVDPASVRVIDVKLVIDGKEYRLTEQGLSRAYTDRHHEGLRFDNTQDQWVLWGQGCWQADNTQQGARKVSEFVWDIMQGVNKRTAQVLGKLASARAIERLARMDPRLATTIHDWDQDPLALAAAGVHVSLADGARRPLEPRDMMTRSTAVVPDLGLPTPIWDQFLWETFGGDIELIEFIPVWFGYALTGDTAAEKFAFLYGTGGNGKGVIVHTMSAIAGSYAVAVGSDLFTQQKYQGHPTELARLCGARMAFGSEVDDHARWDLKRLKQLTGNEGTIHARFMRQDFFEFKPTTKLTITGNHKPAIGHVDDAIARRLLLIPFLFTPPRPDPSLKSRLVAEYPGILGQLIVGAGKALAALATGGAGFTSLVPQSVVLASREYLIGQDDIALWLTERCDVIGGRKGLLCSEAHADYETWCVTEGRSAAVGLRKFKEEIQRAAGIAGMPIAVHHRRRGTVLDGLELKPNKL